MSIAWQDPVVIWREPVLATVRRILVRAVLATLWLVLGGIPGIATGLVQPLFLRIVIWVFALVAVLNFLAAIINAIRNGRVKLRLMPTGSLERPRSVQEIVLGARPEWVAGPVFTVAAEDLLVGFSKRDPHVMISAGDQCIRRFPLYGVEVADFVAQANANAEARGVSFVLLDRE